MKIKVRNRNDELIREIRLEDAKFLEAIKSGSFCVRDGILTMTLWTDEDISVF